MSFEHRFAKSSNGVRIHFLQGGVGEEGLVLLHGWPGYWKDWEKVMPALAEVANLVVMDLRGFGLSDKPTSPEKYTLADYAADVSAVLEEAGLAKAVLCGFDVGSSTSAYFARAYPEKVRKLILLNPSYPGLGKKRLQQEYAHENWYQFFHLLDLAEKLVGYNRDTVKIYLSHFYRHWSYNPEAFSEQDIDEYVDMFYQNGLRGGFNWYRARVKTRYGDWLGGPVTVPTTILWSDHDPVFPLEWSSDAINYFPNSELIIVKECGHFIPREVPEQLIEIIKKVLKS